MRLESVASYRSIRLRGSRGAGLQSFTKAQPALGQTTQQACSLGKKTCVAVARKRDMRWLEGDRVRHGGAAKKQT
ncbi:MAG: hypothetical protein O9341_01960, partial [Paucibacter sp.]|nr:hypothetical protein [Roseateles sp.]